MKKRISKTLPLLLAAIMQAAPLLKNFLMEFQPWSPGSSAFVLKIATATLAIFGYHAISSASSIAVSPPNATVGVPYVGTVTYSGGHAAFSSSMGLRNNSTGLYDCLGTAMPLGNGLSIVYSGGTRATISGTPTSVSNMMFNLKIFDSTGCASGESDIQSTTLVVGSGSGSATAPTMVAPPRSVTSPVGSDVLLSAGAAGNPTPKYYWYLGSPPPFGNQLVSTNSTLVVSNAQFTNAGLYTVIASNASGVTPNSAGQAYLSVAQTPGSNILALHFTNYVAVSNAVVMASYFTNAPAGSNTYKWQYNFIDIPGASPYSLSFSNLSLPANQIYAGNSGVYSVFFYGVVGPTVVVNQQEYDSYWAFGIPPGLTSTPQDTNVNAGANLALSAAAYDLKTPYFNQKNDFYWYLNGSNLVTSTTASGTVTTNHEGNGGAKLSYSISNSISTLILNNVSPASAGAYTIVVSNFWGSFTSSPAMLGVIATPPGIVTQPAPRSVLVGQTTSFSVTASGTAPLSYQWQKVGLGNLSNGGVYSGVTSNILTLNGVSPGEAGNYLVVITNVAGATNSTTVSLAVSPLPPVALTPASPTSVQLRSTTIPGLTYVVQSASNLSPPVIWSPLQTNVVPGNGIVLFTNATANLSQFFRLAFP
jgi:Immunoglobulin domain